MATTMEICSSALRGVIVASPGKKIVVADWSNIEGRALSWLANESWKLKAYRDFDNGIGADLYKLTYAKAFGVPVEDVTKSLRQIGKVMELAFGYGGGVGAWVTFATAFGIDLEKLAESAMDSIPANIYAEALNFYKWTKEQKKSTHGLSENAFIVCDSFKRLWREEHARIEGYWKEIELLAVTAVNSPNKTYLAGKHKIRRDGEWLRISLPSGRCLCYPSPQAEDGKLSYMGLNQFTRKWERLSTYGGKLAENITQAAARDILAYSMLKIEENGYAIVLTVHDEPITETPDTSEYSAEALCKIMRIPPDWAPEIPLAAEGFETYRYHKPD